MALSLTFLGGAEKVTGSAFLIRGEKGSVLFDYGIEQGKEACEACAFEPFPFDVKTLNALIISHSHLDHVGRAPRLVREGFKGKIHMTPPTRDLSYELLKDSASILFQDAQRKGIDPLFEMDDVEQYMAQIVTHEYEETFPLFEGVFARFFPTGHILGSSGTQFFEEGNEKPVLSITSDVGHGSPILPPAKPVPEADVLVIESVYGDRVHERKSEREEVLASILLKTIQRNGTVLIPAFSIERTQVMLYEIEELFKSGAVPRVPVFLDSPLAIKVTEIYRAHAEKYLTVKKDTDGFFHFDTLVETIKRYQSDTILETKGPKIIIAGAGMSHGGRIGRWEKIFLPHKENTLIVVGYQAPGSPGRRIQEGSKEVFIDGERVPVRATIKNVSGWSGHMDRDELLSYVEACNPKDKTVFCALGEPGAQRFIAQRIHDYLGARAIAPEAGSSWKIEVDSVVKIK